ncbi:MAG: sulfotransferase [Bacteroidetes bacterium]|nr:sulfotransferase [Bacteroidota bacterium]
MKAPEPEKWVFILGCYNSGTTLLHKLLATHSDIGSMPNEGQFYSSQLPGGEIQSPQNMGIKTGIVLHQ